MMQICGFAALCASLSVSHGLTTLVRSPVSVRRGQATTLPCWIDPPQSAEGLEVRWYRYDRFDSPIILYQARKLDAPHEASYAGRVSFGLRDAASGGLAAGDVSLRLVNVSTEDAGGYTCYVSSDQGYDRASVSLRVTETGTSPILSVVSGEDHRVNVSCESEGWFPRPRLRWSDRRQGLAPRALEYANVSSGLVSVRSWILAPGSFELSCSVSLADGEAKEARVRLEKPAQQEAGSSAGGWVAFALLLITVLVIGGVLLFKNRARFLGKKNESGKNQAEEGTLLQQNPPAALENQLSQLRDQHYANIDLDESIQNPYVGIRGCILRDANNVKFPDGQSVTCVTAVKGKAGFSSGQHYWEVSLWREGVDAKQSWWVGVTNAAGFPLSKDVPPTASQGFWFLASSRDTADSFQFSTEPKVLLPVHSPRPQTVGVHLNYDGGELSFYNVQGKCIIGSMTAEFSGEVFPFFNPGKDDRAPMEIVHRVAQGGCSQAGNSDINSTGTLNLQYNQEQL